MLDVASAYMNEYVVLVYCIFSLHITYSIRLEVWVCVWWYVHKKVSLRFFHHWFSIAILNMLLCNCRNWCWRRGAERHSYLYLPPSLASICCTHRVCRYLALCTNWYLIVMLLWFLFHLHYSLKHYNRYIKYYFISYGGIFYFILYIARICLQLSWLRLIIGLTLYNVKCGYF